MAEILNKRSSLVLSNGVPTIPLSSQMKYGEIALNYATGAETIFLKNSNDDIVSFSNDNTLIGYIDSNLNNYYTKQLSGNAKIFAGTCSTAAATTAKVVTCPEFTSADLIKGALIFVTFSDTNSGAVANLTLSVNETGAKPIKKIYAASTPANLTSAGELRANQTYLFSYDGTNWVCITLDYNSNTTYSVMSLDELQTGTATTGRTLSALRLNQAYNIDGRTITIGADTIDVPITELSNNYEMSTDENDDLLLEVGDTYEEAFGKLEKAIIDDELIVSHALNDLNTTLSDINAIEHIKIPDPSEIEGDTVEINISSNKIVTIPAVNDAIGDETYGLMSPSQKTKLDGIASGAEVNVLSDWNQTTTSADDYIKNKPDISGMIQNALVSSALSGTPTAPTADSEVNNTQIATTNFVHNLIKDYLIGKYLPIEFERFYRTYDAKFTGSRSTNNGVKVESGTAKINTIYGVTFVWNQLFDAVGTTVTPIVGSTYLLQIDGVRSIIVADANTSAFVSTTSTDMCINLRHLYGANPSNFPFTIAQFEEFFPLPYYSYDAGRLMNMAITSFTSQGTDKDGNVFYKAINLPITTMTGKLNGSGNSEVVFPNGMWHAYGLASAATESYPDRIIKVDGVWKAVQQTHFVAINLANVTWANAGHYSSLYSATNAVMPIGTGDTSSINVVCDKFVSRRNTGGNFVKGYTAMYPGSVGNNTCFVLCRDEPKVGVANFVYPKKTASTYVLDDEYQAMLNEVFPTNDGGTEIVYPSNGVSPTTTPVNFKIDYPVIDYEVKRICVDNWGGNYVEGEITRSEAEEVTTLAGKFYQNTAIRRFNELKYFKKIGSMWYSGTTSASKGQFYNCSNLEEITIPSATINDFRGAFRGTTLKRIDISPTRGTSLNLYYACCSLSSLTYCKLAGTNYSQLYGAFYGCTYLNTLEIDGTANLSSVTALTNLFYSCSRLTTITGTITGINVSISCSPCSSLSTASAIIILNGLADLDGGSATASFSASKQTEYEANSDFNTAVTAATANGWTIAYA